MPFIVFQKKEEILCIFCFAIIFMLSIFPLFTNIGKKDAKKCVCLHPFFPI